MKQGDSRKGNDERPQAVRLIFEYKGNKIKLISEKNVEMIAPPAETRELGKKASGFWCEVKDSKGKSLYRRVMQNPIPYAAEVRTDDPRMPLAWQEPTEDMKGQFVVVIPRLEKAAKLSLFSSPLSPKKSMEPAKELKSFALGRLGGGKEAK